MAGDPLYEPLGLDRRPAAPPARRRRLWFAVVGAIAILAGIASMTAVRRRGPDPAVAVVAIDPAPTSSTPKVAATPADPTSPPGAKIVSLEPQAPALNGSAVEVQNGVKIVRFGPAASAASITIPVEGAAGAALSPAPDPRLVEKTADGPLPRIGQDGRRPADVYGRSAAMASGPRVAVLLTGMGLDQVATAGAARRLSADMSFAFAPGIADVGAQVAEARRAGHEVFLDLTRDTDTASADAPATGVAVLHRGMAGFVGYAGVLLGAQSPDALVGDLIRRGVQPLFVSSGATSSELASTADVLLDGSSAAAVAGSLDRLVALVQHNGSAVAVVRDAAAAEGALAALAAGLAAHGVTLVPVTSLAHDRGRKAVTLKAADAPDSRKP